MKSRRIRSMTVKLCAAVVLSLAIQTSPSAFAAQLNPVSFDVPAAFSSIVSKASVPFSDPEQLLSDGPQNLRKSSHFLIDSSPVMQLN